MRSRLLLVAKLVSLAAATVAAFVAGMVALGAHHVATHDNPMGVSHAHTPWSVRAFVGGLTAVSGLATVVTVAEHNDNRPDGTIACIDCTRETDTGHDDLRVRCSDCGGAF